MLLKYVHVYVHVYVLEEYSSTNWRKKKEKRMRPKAPRAFRACCTAYLPSQTLLQGRGHH
jgi:hypothetical protein